jgi:predicted dehydrogenase
MPVQWGVIGCGGIARRRTIPEGFAPSAEAQLVAVQDVDADRAREVGETFGVPAVYIEEAELLGDPEVEAVYIASPTDLHRAHVLAAASAGKHVLCEKPLGLDVFEAEEIVAACCDAGAKLGVNFMMRFHACHTYLRDLRAAGRLGMPVLGKAELSCWYPPIPAAFRQDPATGGGGALLDMGNHCVDLLEFILGQRVACVSCFTANLVQAYRSEDTAAVLLEFDGGAMGLVSALFNVPDAAAKNMLCVYGSGGGAWAFGTIGQDSGGEVHVTAEGEAGGYDAGQVRAGEAGEETVRPATVNIYRAHVDALSRAIAGGGEPPVPGEDGLWSQRVMAACYQSAASGRAVEVVP